MVDAKVTPEMTLDKALAGMDEGKRKKLEEAASIKNTQPPLKNTHDGVQMRFTTGQTPASPNSQPANRQMIPAVASQQTLSLGARSPRNTPPAIRPRIRDRGDAAPPPIQ